MKHSKKYCVVTIVVSFIITSSLYWTFFSSIQFNCLVMSNSLHPMDCSMPGLPVPHHLPESAQVHVHCIGDAIQPSHTLMPFSCPQSFPASRTFPMSCLLTSDDRNTGASASASVLPVKNSFQEFTYSKIFWGTHSSAFNCNWNKLFLIIVQYLSPTGFLVLTFRARSIPLFLNVY